MISSAELLKVATPHVQDYFGDLFSNPLRIFTGLGYVFGLYNRFTAEDPSSTDSASMLNSVRRLNTIPNFAAKFVKKHDGGFNGLNNKFNQKFNGDTQQSALDLVNDMLSFKQLKGGKVQATAEELAYEFSVTYLIFSLYSYVTLFLGAFTTFAPLEWIQAQAATYSIIHVVSGSL